MARKALTNGFVALARRGSEFTWKLGAGRKPPKASDTEAPLREVLLWGALSGAAVAIAKALAARQASPPRSASGARGALAPDAGPTGEQPGVES